MNQNRSRDQKEKKMAELRENARYIFWSRFHGQTKRYFYMINTKNCSLKGAL